MELSKAIDSILVEITKLLNKILSALAEYKEENPNIIKKNKNNRAEDIKDIAKLVYTYAYKQNYLDTINMDDLPEVITKKSCNNINVFDENTLQNMINAINTKLDQFKISIGHNVLKEKLSPILTTELTEVLNEINQDRKKLRAFANKQEVPPQPKPSTLFTQPKPKQESSKSSQQSEQELFLMLETNGAEYNPLKFLKTNFLQFLKNLKSDQIIKLGEFGLLFPYAEIPARSIGKEDVSKFSKEVVEKGIRYIVRFNLSMGDFIEKIKDRNIEDILNSITDVLPGPIGANYLIRLAQERPQFHSLVVKYGANGYKPLKIVVPYPVTVIYSHHEFKVNAKEEPRLFSISTELKKQLNRL